MSSTNDQTKTQDVTMTEAQQPQGQQQQDKSKQELVKIIKHYKDKHDKPFSRLKSWRPDLKQFERRQPNHCQDPKALDSFRAFIPMTNGEK
ncbi:hypothetical protein O0I10_006296 [Lichtheimia ornata]|uniref:Uncharacterized protein n=1 Tax=Lichtheimia ornata TaxID=688661 RepID=A0AAD7XXD6_9FUNG|nr:uncharacterized protein O0I10_006296 [Lichtheimia ornata]KAJ8658025.1 hypothetical protein O0I10_006296 [Lichtheimia ornata]